MASHPHPGIDARTHWLAERTDTAPGVIAGLSPGEREELARRVANEQVGIDPDDADDSGGDESESATQSQAAASQSQSDSRGIAAGSRDARGDGAPGASLGDHVRNLTGSRDSRGDADSSGGDASRDPPVFTPMASSSDDGDPPVFTPNADANRDAASNQSNGSGYTDSLGVLRQMNDR